MSFVIDAGVAVVDSTMTAVVEVEGKTVVGSVVVVVGSTVVVANSRVVVSSTDVAGLTEGTAAVT